MWRERRVLHTVTEIWSEGYVKSGYPNSVLTMASCLSNYKRGMSSKKLLLPGPFCSKICCE